MSTPSIVTTPQVATRIGKSARTVQRLVHDGKIKPLPQRASTGPSAPYLFDATEVDRYVATLTVQTAA